MKIKQICSNTCRSEYNVDKTPSLFNMLIITTMLVSILMVMLVLS
jgi:predicted nucleic acid-binding Zn ribbon protein